MLSAAEVKTIVKIQEERVEEEGMESFLARLGVDRDVGLKLVTEEGLDVLLAGSFFAGLCCALELNKRTPEDELEQMTKDV